MTLLFHWPLSDRSGTVAADVAGGADGTLTDGAAYASDFPSRCEFDGVDDYVDCGTTPDVPASTGAFSLAAFFRSDDLFNCSSEDCRIVSKATDTGTQDHFWMLSTIGSGPNVFLRARIRIAGSTGTIIATSGALVDGREYHAALIYNGSLVRLYLDGIVVAEVADSGDVNQGPGVRCLIGAAPVPAGEDKHWIGAIRDVRIYDNALTALELSAVIRGGQVNCARPVGTVTQTGWDSVPGGRGNTRVDDEPVHDVDATHLATTNPSTPPFPPPSPPPPFAYETRFRMRVETLPVCDSPYGIEFRMVERTDLTTGGWGGEAKMRVYVDSGTIDFVAEVQTVDVNKTSYGPPEAPTYERLILTQAQIRTLLDSASGGSHADLFLEVVTPAAVAGDAELRVTQVEICSPPPGRLFGGSTTGGALCSALGAVSTPSELLGSGSTTGEGKVSARLFGDVRIKAGAALGMAICSAKGKAIAAGKASQAQGQAAVIGATARAIVSPRGRAETPGSQALVTGLARGAARGVPSQAQGMALVSAKGKAVARGRPSQAQGQGSVDGARLRIIGQASPSQAQGQGAVSGLLRADARGAGTTTGQGLVTAQGRSSGSLRASMALGGSLVTAKGVILGSGVSGGGVTLSQGLVTAKAAGSGRLVAGRAEGQGLVTAVGAANVKGTAGLAMGQSLASAKARLIVGIAGAFTGGQSLCTAKGRAIVRGSAKTGGQSFVTVARLRGFGRAKPTKSLGQSLASMFFLFREPAERYQASNEQLRVAFESAMARQGLTILYENVDYLGPDNALWVRFLIEHQHRGLLRIIEKITGERYQHKGHVLVSFFAPLLTGDSEIARLIDLTLDFFTDDLPDEIRFEPGPSVRRLGRAGKWYRVDLRIPFVTGFTD